MKHITSTIALLVLVAGCSNEENPYRVVGQLASDRYEMTAEQGPPFPTFYHFLRGLGVPPLCA